MFRLVVLFLCLFQAKPLLANLSDSMEFTYETMGEMEVFSDCQADLFFSDFGDRFDSRDGFFDWCFQRVKWWELDRSDGWRDRFCQISKFEEYGRTFWRGRFWHKFNTYSAQYSSQLFDLFRRDLNYRLFQGWSGRIEVRFGKTCGGYGY